MLGSVLPVRWSQREDPGCGGLRGVQEAGGALNVSVWQETVRIHLNPSTALQGSRHLSWPGVMWEDLEQVPSWNLLAWLPELSIFQFHSTL